MGSSYCLINESSRSLLNDGFTVDFLITSGFSIVSFLVCFSLTDYSFTQNYLQSRVALKIINHIHNADMIADGNPSRPLHFLIVQIGLFSNTLKWAQL